MSSQTKRTPWALLLGALVALSAILGFISNAGGARNAVCSLPAVHGVCLQYGLMRADAPAPEQLQRHMMERLNGTWGRLDRNCAETVAYRVEQGEAGVWRIYATATGFESTMQVTAIDPAAGAIAARGFQPNAAGVRELWEFRPEGDVLALRDPAGTETTLARCPG